MPEVQQSDRVCIHGKWFIPFLERQSIDNAVLEIAQKINNDYADKSLACVVVMKGALMFASDVIRAISLPCTLDFLTARSYGSSLESSGTVTLADTLPNMNGKDILIIEDIVDTGLTMQKITEEIHATMQPSSVAICTLLNKPSQRKVPIEVAYIGFEIPPSFVVGYGLDYAEYGRNLPSIYILDSQQENINLNAL